MVSLTLTFSLNFEFEPVGGVIFLLIDDERSLVMKKDRRFLSNKQSFPIIQEIRETLWESEEGWV